MLFVFMQRCSFATVSVMQTKLFVFATLSVCNAVRLQRCPFATLSVSENAVRFATLLNREILLATSHDALHHDCFAKRA